MGPGYWLLAVFNAVAAALLINAGVAKLIAPASLLRAVAEVARLSARPGGELLVRELGAAELAVVVALLVPQARWPAAAAATLLGLCFAAAGAAGLRRGSSVPCGCFGGASGQPLGWANIGLGAVLAAAWPVNALTWRLPWPAYPAVVVELASIATVAGCLWLNRRLITRLFLARRSGPGTPGPARTVPAQGEVS